MYRFLPNHYEVIHIRADTLDQVVEEIRRQKRYDWHFRCYWCEDDHYILELYRCKSHKEKYIRCKIFKGKCVYSDPRHHNCKECDIYCHWYYEQYKQYIG